MRGGGDRRAMAIDLIAPDAIPFATFYPAVLVAAWPAVSAPVPWRRCSAASWLVRLRAAAVCMVAADHRKHYQYVPVFAAAVMIVWVAE